MAPRNLELGPFQMKIGLLNTEHIGGTQDLLFGNGKTKRDANASYYIFSNVQQLVFIIIRFRFFGKLFRLWRKVKRSETTVWNVITNQPSNLSKLSFECLHFH